MESKKGESAIPNPLDDAKQLLADEIINVIKTAYDVDLSDVKTDILGKLGKPAKAEHGEVAWPVFMIAKRLAAKEKNPNAIAATVAAALQKRLEETTDAPLAKLVDTIAVTGGYVNFHFSLTFLGGVVASILDGSFLKPLPSEGKMRVMIEYSQPNTHKAFHVGHMRNAALGDSLVRFYEQMGHPVVAANYFGDEGAHVAKCLWLLRKRIAEGELDLAKVADDNRGEFLGGLYAESVELLDMGLATSYPCPGVYAARVLSKSPHPNPEAPANWHVVEVEMREGEKATVVCGGDSYEVGDVVAYVPVGGRLAGKAVTPMDKMGVESHGVICAIKELGLEDESAKPEKKEKKKEKKPEKGEDGKKEEPKSKEDKKKAKEDKKKAKAEKKEGKQPAAQEKKEKKAPAAPVNKILVLPATVKPGTELPEAGRLPTAVGLDGKPLPADVSVSAEFQRRNEEVGAVLRALETGEKDTCALWEETKQWSLQDFKRIYKWLEVRFDHDFYESEVSEESLKLVQEYREKGVFVDNEGAVGVDLKKFGLPFCILLKSNGSGLYATKDLALAVRKFENFKIDKSIYVVDVAQSLHFQQVFKTLELMGYEKAKNCFHLAYGTVVLPSGKMSSRKGTVIYFRQLRDLLNEEIFTKHLAKYKGDWSDDEIEEAKQVIAVATIKWGMLNHDAAKDITFVLSEWSAKTGNTGPYLLYQTTRIASLLREVQPAEGQGAVNFKLLTHPHERAILLSLNNYWSVVEACATGYNTSAMCTYLFELARGFSAWYEAIPRLKAMLGSDKQEDKDVLRTRLQFAQAIGAVLRSGLGLLGIRTLERM